MKAAKQPVDMGSDSGVNRAKVPPYSAFAGLMSNMKDAPEKCDERFYTQIAAALQPLNVLKGRTLEHRVTFDEFSDAIIERAFGSETGVAEALVGDNIVALVRILADFGEMNEK